MKSGNIFQQTNTKSTKKKPRFTVQDGVFEQLRSVGGGIKKGLKNDLLKGMGSTAANSIFNPRKLGEQGSRTEFSPFSRERKQPLKIERPRETFVYSAKEAEMSRKVEEIRAELKAMIEQLKSVDKEIEKSVSTPIVETGVYYENYLDRLKAVLEVLRKELGDSNTWLAMSQSRKKQKGYWSMYKKKGTQFGLSGERRAVTQTG